MLWWNFGQVKFIDVDVAGTGLKQALAGFGVEVFVVVVGLAEDELGVVEDETSSFSMKLSPFSTISRAVHDYMLD